MTAACRTFFLDAGPRGQRLCVFHAAQGVAAPVGQVLLLPPFGEELNKSRRMLALASRAMAAAGFDVLMMDLLGCGDSSGDFGDADWIDWQEDAVLAAQWLTGQAHAQVHAHAPARAQVQVHAQTLAKAQPHPRADAHGSSALPLWLWGVRAGALLAPAVAARMQRPLNLLLWQPVTAGKLQLQQFLRLKVAADLAGGQAKGAMQALRAQLDLGEPVEIAGYTLSPRLAQGLEQAQLKPELRSESESESESESVSESKPQAQIQAQPQAESASGSASASAPESDRLTSQAVQVVRQLDTRFHHVIWLETSVREEAALSPAGATGSDAWRAAGCEVQALAVKGPSFWAAAEIEVAPQLITATVEALMKTAQGRATREGAPA